MPTPFSILTGKEGAQPKKPLMLVTITAPDGDVTRLTTAASYGAPNIVYGGNTYLARIQRNDIAAIQAISPQGYDTLPGFTLTLADADRMLWTNHCLLHGWRGADVKLTVILWDVVNNAYSTDALQWSFIGGNPQFTHVSGTLTMEATSSTNFTRLKVPSIPLEYRCPWDFPSTYAQRVDGLTNPTSVYYQCGYSADVAGGCGNLSSGSAFTACDYTRSSPSDPSVGCMARMGNPSATSVAPDGDLEHDIAGNHTGRFGGVTWMAPKEFSGTQYTSGQKVFGYNQPNTSTGSFYNWVYGTQWVKCDVLAPAGEPNSLRAEAVVCVSAFGNANVMQLLVNGVQVPQNNSDVLFTWRYINQGGRSGHLNGDKIFDKHGDPHGSKCVVEFVVPSQLASGGVPNVQALVTSGPILNCYAIDHITSGVITFTGPNWSLAAAAPSDKVIITGNSNPALNGLFTVSASTGGNPGTATLSGTSASGTGGGVFFYQQPDLWDTGGSIMSNPTGNYVNLAGPACNLPFAYLDLMTWGNVQLSQIDPVSWYNAAQISARQITYTAANGSAQTHAQFKASFALPGNSRAALAQVMTALRNSGNLMVAPNSITGKIQSFIRQTLAEQQPTDMTALGSNDSDSRASFLADGTSARGYFAYLFDESNIEKDSFKITTTRIESTPNTVAFAFQDEYNGYQQDSLTEINPLSYAYSGNQEIGVPVPVNAVPNFDQGSRIANVQLAEALYGNPRNDPGGTLYFEFRTNHRVLHLASRLGYICGLKWQSEGIGVSSPQAIRLLSVQPDTDGEHWTVKAMWHSCVWYTYAYGQNPTPYQMNPLLSPPARPPYPWRPGVAVWGNTDPLFPGKHSFDFGVDTNVYPAQLAISGTLPANVQPNAGRPPLVPLQSATANTGGTIKPGTYQIQFSVDGVNGPVSQPTVVVVPSGTNTNTITVSGIQWQSGAAPAIQPYIGMSSLTMHAAAGASYAGSTPDADGNPTTYTFTAYSPDGLGMPDINACAVEVQETGIVHGGVWGDAVGLVDGTGKILTFGATWTANQWAGYTLTLYYRAGADPQPALNMVVTSSTAHTLTVPAVGFLPGDVVVMRAKSAHITANTIGDDNFANGGGSGLTVDGEAGNLIQIIAGTGAWQPAKTIVSNTATVFTIAGAWDVTPDATSVYIVLSPVVIYPYRTGTFTGTGGGAGTVATTPAVTTNQQSLLVQVAVTDKNGAMSPWAYQPFREVYVPPQATDPAPTVVVTTSVTADAKRQNILANAAAGALTVTLRPFSEWLTLPIAITKSDSTGNVVTWQTTGADTVLGEGSTGTLTVQGETITITATQP